MEATFVEQSVRGKIHKVPAVTVHGRAVVAHGTWLRVASIHDEDWLDGELVTDPQDWVRQLRQSALKADLFTFAQPLSETEPRFSYPWDPDNLAVIRITTHEAWWKNALPQETRKNVRRSAKRGVEVRAATFDDALVEGITVIYNETPVRQGRSFWHYGKDPGTVKRENASYLDRSLFIGAFCQEELIGFIKIVFVNDIANIMQILAKNSHQDKRPMNALVSKAVEECEARGYRYLVYGKYEYHPKTSSPLATFKKRNGFEEVTFPRYYVPLTAWGSLAARFGLHRGMGHFIPGPVMNAWGAVRARMVRQALTPPGGSH